VDVATSIIQRYRSDAVSRDARRVLIIVQNLPVPLDRRVWLECQALVHNAIGVSVICPKGPGDPWLQEIDGVTIYKYRPPPVANGFAAYAYEFAYCWAITALLSVVVALRDGFSAIQACNPPDTYFALARIWKLFGKRFVYDQHDLNPEVFISRFGEPTGVSARLQLRTLKALERITYRTSDHVISTNESYRSIALTRGSLSKEHVTVVRSGPDTTTMRPITPRPDLRNGRQYLAVYLGIMGPQDGVDITLRALDLLIRLYGRTDCSLALLGFGDCLADLKQLANDLNLNDYVTFTGRVGPREIAEYLSTADVGLCPDPKSPLNDVSTMNKTMEYMAYALPTVSFDLVETRVSAGESARYVMDGDLPGFARAWDELLRRRRNDMWKYGSIYSHHRWREHAPRYLGGPPPLRRISIVDSSDSTMRVRWPNSSNIVDAITDWGWPVDVPMVRSRVDSVASRWGCAGGGGPLAVDGNSRLWAIGDLGALRPRHTPSPYGHMSAGGRSLPECRVTLIYTHHAEAEQRGEHT
jgi:glycosyltransferase involved in cell wall biosynthesis